jgi:hypothetical protein
MKTINVTSAIFLCILITAASSLKKFKTHQEPACFVPNPYNFEYRQSWTISNGEGQLTFKSRGNDFYIRLYDANLATWSYQIIFGGENNTKLWIINPAGENLCWTWLSLNPNIQYSWRIIWRSFWNFFDIRDMDNGEMWYCNPSAGMGSAANAHWYAMSRWNGGAWSEICDVVAGPYVSGPKYKLVSSFSKR